MRDITGRRLFFQLLHKARELKGNGWEYMARQTSLCGMMQTMIDNYEDFRIADSMRSYWANLNSGAD